MALAFLFRPETPCTHSVRYCTPAKERGIRLYGEVWNQVLQRSPVPPQEFVFPPLQLLLCGLVEKDFGLVVAGCDEESLVLQPLTTWSCWVQLWQCRPTQWTRQCPMYTCGWTTRRWCATSTTWVGPGPPCSHTRPANCGSGA